MRFIGRNEEVRRRGGGEGGLVSRMMYCELMCCFTRGGEMGERMVLAG